jgi:hypothetical protein
VVSEKTTKFSLKQKKISTNKWYMQDIGARLRHGCAIKRGLTWMKEGDRLGNRDANGFRKQRIGGDKRNTRKPEGLPGRSGTQAVLRGRGTVGMAVIFHMYFKGQMIF